jgi:adenylosuccinate synthase
MRRAILTVGLGFGDEGKGAAVDFLARRYAADLVVRYCGGSQAGHNVELPDGRRHTFSQFGAGTLASPAPARTYLGPRVVIDPLALLREARHLSELAVKDPLDLLAVHPRCLVTTHWHKTLNRLRELSRGVGRHGSCGQGIGEARSYWLAHGADAVFAADLGNLDVLRDKLELQRQRALLELQGFLHAIDPAALEEMDLWDLTAEAAAADLYEAGERLAISAEVPECETAIFEGAQGVLLDEYRGFHPHTTWSTVTLHHAWELVQQAEAEEVAVLGVTRAYATRHGAGPLPTFSPELTARLQDPGNPPNAWQGGLRCGWLDLPLLRYAAAVVGPLAGLVVNHLDQVADAECMVCEEYRNLTLSPSPVPNLSAQERLGEQLRQAEPVLVAATSDDLHRRLGEIAPVVLTGFGPTHEDRSGSGLRFRSRRRRPQLDRLASIFQSPGVDGLETRGRFGEPQPATSRETSP